MSDTFRPVLRPELIQAPQPDGSLTLCDPVTDCLLSLPASQTGLLELLEGELTSSDVERVAGPGASASLRAMALLGLLLGTCERERRRLLEVAAGGPAASASLPLALLQGTRVDPARAPGAGAFPLGPLSPAERAALEARLGSAALVQVPLVDPRDLDVQGSYLAEPAQLEPAEEPLAWQLFPLSLLPTANALVVADRGWSEHFPADSAEGGDVVEEFDRWRPLLRAAARRSRLRRGPVQLPGGLPVLSLSLRETLPLLIQRVDSAPGDAWGALAAARGALLAFARAAGEVPLGPRLGARLQAGYEALLVEEAPPGGEGARSALRLAAERVSSCEPLALACRSPRSSPTPAASQALRRLLRQRLHGAPYEEDGVLSVSFAREALALALLERVASRRASAAGEAEFGPAHLGAAGAALLPLLDAPARSEALRELGAELDPLLLDFAPGGSAPSGPLI
ncbi:MAG TPA: hypothetical protein DEA08_11825 [Planctomycetes bacterium]|nr:hypothetical protein [Planctomycetota bacterium]